MSRCYARGGNFGCEVGGQVPEEGLGCFVGVVEDVYPLRGSVALVDVVEFAVVGVGLQFAECEGVVSCEVLDFADDFSLQGEYEWFSACVDGQLLVEVAERSGIIDGGDGEFLSHSDGFGV